MFSGTKFKLAFVSLLLLCMFLMPSVAWAALSIETTSLPSARSHVFYSEYLSASGGDGSYTWSRQSGSLPPGLTFYNWGYIEGTPTTTGDYNFTVKVSDGSGNSDTKAFNLRVLVASGPIISTTSLPVAQLNVSYSTTLAATQGQSPYTWSIPSGSLPPGLSLSTAGTISGSPTTAGTYSFTIRVRDNQGRTSDRSLSLSVVSIFITTESLPDATRRGLYNEPLYASGGVGSYTWSLSSGSLPRGITLLSEGYLTGVPTSTGNHSFTVSVRDGSNRSVTKSLSLRVVDRGVLKIITDTADLPVLTPGIPVLFALEAEGGDPPYNWSMLASDLPHNLRLHNNGTISGTAQVEGKYAFTVQAFDQSGLFSNKKFTLEVKKATPVQTPSGGLPAGDGSLGIHINGQRLLTDTAPFLHGGRTFVPLRSVFEKLGAQVIWNEALRQVTIIRQGAEITMQAGKKEARLNGRPVMMDAAPIMSNGRLMVPLRFVGEALGAEVHWDQKTRQVNIIQ